VVAAKAGLATGFLNLEWLGEFNASTVDVFVVKARMFEAK